MALALLRGGAGIRFTGRQTGISKATVGRMLPKEERSAILCPCGAPSNHRGWCKHRISLSPARQAYLALFPQKERREKVALPDFYPFLNSEPTEEHDLVLAVDRIVPKGLARDVRADVCQEMILAVLSGDATLETLPDSVGDYLRAHWKAYPSRYGPLSLDAPFGKDGDGATLGEMVADLNSVWNSDRAGLTWRDSSGKIVYAERGELQDEPLDCGGPYPADWCACDRCGEARESRIGRNVGGDRKGSYGGYAPAGDPSRRYLPNGPKTPRTAAPTAPNAYHGEMELLVPEE